MEKNKLFGSDEAPPNNRGHVAILNLAEADKLGVQLRGIGL